MRPQRARCPLSQGDKESEEENGVERVDGDVHEMMRACAGTEQRNLAHVREVGHRHPDAAVPHVRERLAHVRPREAVLHECAAVRVVGIVQTQELEVAGLAEERPDEAY